MNVTCYTCEGTGEYPPGTTCPTCGGSGEIIGVGVHEITQAYVEEINTKVATIALLSNIFRSYLILECLDETEYDALSESNKTSLQFLLQCGQVDLNDGKAGKVRLWNWFGAESTTRASLIALLA